MQLRNIFPGFTLAASMFMAQLSVAQAPPSGPPSGTPPAAGGQAATGVRVAASKDPAAAPAGTYTLDLLHSAVLARILHNGVSYNVVRFGVKQGSLVWDAANTANIKLDVTVNTKAYLDPIVYRIPVESDTFMDSAKFPEVRFVSTAVRATGDNRYEIDGQLTLLGVTKPAQIRASLIGVVNNAGGTTIGFTGSTDINWVDFKGPRVALGVITVGLDAEFMKR